MPERPRRHHELVRLYLAVGMAVASWVAFRFYRILSPKVEVGLDPTSRWTIMAVGLLNTLAIATLLFIVVRSLAKLYFERRRGILGNRIRTKLVLALLGVGIVPSLLLYNIGQDFISKNIRRWFVPETQALIVDSRAVAEALRREIDHRLHLAGRELVMDPQVDPEVLRQRFDLDFVSLLAESGPRRAVKPGLVLPQEGAGTWEGLRESSSGLWRFHTVAGRGQVGISLPREIGTRLSRVERRVVDAEQVSRNQNTLESPAQDTILLLTLLSVFAAVWTGMTLSRAFTQPVKELADAAHEVGVGNLHIRVPEDGQDELGFLSRSFNRMVEDLQSSRAAVEEQAERIERQRAYLGQLLEALPVGILSWHTEGELRTFNPLARSWYGLEVWRPGQPAWEELVQQARFGSLADLVALVRTLRRPLFQEIRVGTESEGRPVRAMVVPLEEGGELAVLEDLSELAQAEKRAAWQEVARRMAHEVKNPLTPIKLTAQRMLRRGREGRLEPQLLVEGAETILAEVTSLQRLVDSFSEFAKLPAPHPANLDAVELVRQVGALYQPNHPGMTWILDLPEGAVPVYWDGDMVRRALINLVDNALGASGGRGTLRLALQTQGGRVQLEVEDDGPGIPPEDQERLFQPYFSTKKKGTGLGLAIVRRIAQDHRGDASFEPLPQGCRFRLDLPTGLIGS